MKRDVANSVREASRTLEVARESLQTLTTTVNDETLVQLNSTLTEFEKTSQLLRKRLSEKDPLTVELIATLRQLSSAARSARDLAETLEEQPESLVRGKRYDE